MPHTGETLLRNPTLLQSIAQSLQNGLGLVETARNHHVAPETLNAAIANIRSQNKQYDADMGERLGKAASDLLRTYQTDIDQGRVGVRDKPIAMAVLLDKRAMLLQDSASKNPDTIGPDINSVRTELENLTVNITINQSSTVRTEPSPTIDCPSTVLSSTDQTGGGG